METVPLRSLVTHLKTISDNVEAGATVLVTNRGRPIAALTPINEEKLEKWLKEQAAVAS